MYFSHSLISVEYIAAQDVTCASIPETDRVECGWPGVSQQQCEFNLCCFLVSLDYPDCFYPASKWFIIFDNLKRT